MKKGLANLESKKREGGETESEEEKQERRFRGDWFWFFHFLSKGLPREDSITGEGGFPFC